MLARVMGRFTMAAAGRAFDGWSTFVGEQKAERHIVGRALKKLLRSNMGQLKMMMMSLNS